MPCRLRMLAVVVALVAAGSLAGASRVEDLLGTAYQNDGDQGRDADDACVPFPQGPALRLSLGQPPFHGLLVPVDDPADHYRLDAEPGQVVTVRLWPMPALPPALGAALQGLRVLDASCQPVGGHDERAEGAPVQRTFVVPDTPWAVVAVHLRLPGAPLAAPGPGAENCDPPCDLAGYRLQASLA